MKVRLKAVWLYVRRIWQAYGKDSGGLMAAALAFYGLLSLVPLLSLGVAILGAILGSSQHALNSLQNAIEQALPGNGDMIYDTLSGIKEGTGLAGIAGLVGLAFSASAIFTNMELALNNMWKAERMRAWWSQRLVALGTSLLVLLLLLASLAVTSVLTWLQNRQIPGYGEASHIPFVWTVIGHLVPLALSILMFTVLYKIVPNCVIEWRSAVRGGIFAGVAWELAKLLFAVYVGHFAHYNKVYGSLGAIVSLMFWAYYSATILFLGGEIAADRGHDYPALEPPAANIPHAQPREEG